MITQGQTTSFKAELYEGVHDLLTDDIFIALYDGNANLTESTTVYTSDNEITGTGYTGGGQLLLDPSVNTYDTTAYVSFANASWAGATFTCRCALIYNASQGNKSIAVLDFGSDKTVTNSTFTITFPPDTADSAIIRTN